jgi:hypothetical protein
MEEMLMQSSQVELGIWEVFAQSRISISIIFLGNVISVLIAIWLSRVLIEKGANLFLKLIFTAFAFAVFLNAFNNGQWVNFYLDGFATSLANLDAVNGTIDISATSKDFIDSVTSQGIFGKIGMFVFFVSGLLIAVIPLWFNTNNKKA